MHRLAFVGVVAAMLSTAACGSPSMTAKNVSAENGLVGEMRADSRVADDTNSATTATNDGANENASAAAQNAAAAEQARRNMEMFGGDYVNQGGIPGCINSSVTGRERRVAERLGGQPCAENPPQAQSSGGIPQGQGWLVGWWIEREEFCGEGGVTYRANGTFSTDIASGRWRLEGSALIETVLSRSDGEMGDPTVQPVANPRPERSQILSVAANRNAFSVRYPDGRVWHMKRCS